MSPKAKQSKASTPPANAAAGAGTANSWLDRSLRLASRFERFFWDIGGVVMLAFGLMTFLALLFPGLTRGIVITWWATSLQFWLGWGSVWVISAVSVLGLWMLRRGQIEDMGRIPWGRILALEIAAFSSLALLSVLGGTSLTNAERGLDGGIIGWGLAELLRILFTRIGFGAPFWRLSLLATILFVSLIAGMGLFGPLAAWARRYSSAATQLEMDFDMDPAVSEAPLPGQEAATTTRAPSKKKRSSLPARFRKNFRLQDAGQKSSPPPPRDERLPPLKLLVDEKSSRPDERNINLTAGLIEKTLAEFGIPAKVIGFRVGPTVTQFAVEPGFLEKEKADNSGDLNRHKVRVAQISSLARDLALALSAERLRIQAPVPGRPFIGIEVPNSSSTVVRLRPLLEDEAFYSLDSPLAIALGRDVSGQPVAADLVKMPHLLIAGTTGSGKSVCIAAITTCLVMNNAPEDLRLVMVDPKMVELVRFNGLPHLYGKVETDLERILGVLRWTVAEMDHRYKLLEATRSRSIETYNRKARRRKNMEVLPRIVLMIDELADLMMSAPDQTEHNLVRLAQMARATGIHLVVATQRPSTDVVTGLIKANFPARLSFAMASSIDSRVILDAVGAETLLGRGDMLFLQPEEAAPLRSQGAMVSDQEIERVIAYWQKTVDSSDEESPPWEELLEKEAILADRDDLVEKAIKLVQQTQRASASMLQRRLRIGYPRAARLIDELEELGVVGPSQGGGRDREVFVSPDDNLMDMFEDQD
jgi:S-DNA-T family DNA segregation ATPase FtsK/SpoIIIE